MSNHIVLHWAYLVVMMFQKTLTLFKNINRKACKFEQRHFCWQEIGFVLQRVNQLLTITAVIFDLKYYILEIFLVKGFHNWIRIQKDY